MRTETMLRIFLLHAVLSCDCLATSTGSPDRHAHLLSWKIVAENIRNGSRFCENKDLHNRRISQNDGKRIKGVDPNCDYAYQPNQAVTVELPPVPARDESLERIDIDLARWASDSWEDIGRIRAIREPNEIIVPDGIEEEGFFRLSFALKAQDGDLAHFETFAVVCSNWKRDILSSCYRLKGEIELNPDTELIRHSIAVSHFDHTMEMVSQATFLSGRILSAFTDAIISKKAFDDGEYPNLVRGLNKIRLRRFEGAGIAEFVVFVPDNYDHSRKWPLFLHTDPRRIYPENNYSERSGLIDVWWHFSMPMGFDWKDYTHLLTVLSGKLNIDEDRMYVYGDCANGISAMALGLKYPDRWAECSTSLGNSYRHLAGNAFNLPLSFVKGGHNEDPLIGYFDFAVKCFQYHGCRNFRHSKTQGLASVRGSQVPEAVREMDPQRVLFTIESLHNPRAYWVEVGGRKDENLPGTIDACVWGQTILVRTENIDSYNLDLSQAPIDTSRPVEIIENRHSLGFTTGLAFANRANKYADAKCIKNEHLHGPVWDVFTEPYVVVYGTGGTDRAFCKASGSLADSLRHGAPCFADVNMPEELIDTHNLILVGTPESNSWLSKISKNLPVQIERGCIKANGQCYDAHDTGAILIYPNPLNPGKYVAVFFGTSPKVMASIPKVYSQMKSLRPADVGVFEITRLGSAKWHVIEKFDTVWGWHDNWDQVLTVVDKKHPKWQWRQWVAKVIREQLETDAVVCEDPFMFEDSELAGETTYRNLFNNIRNDWIVTIRLDGNNLRKLLMVPFSDITKREVAAPTVYGIGLVKNPLDAGEKILTISELVDSAIYTVALPQKCINGQRMGLVLQDYQILDEAYLVPILAEYLGKNGNADIDAQLDSLKFSVF